MSTPDRASHYNPEFEVRRLDHTGLPPYVMIDFGHDLKIALRPARARTLADQRVEVATDAENSTSTGAAGEQPPPRHPAGVVFKHMDEKDGEPVGRIIVVDDEGHPLGEAKELGWVTRTMAKQIAEKQGFSFEED